ncbi:MAG: hypothetical protein FJ030_06700 [Chloroflexi bacterium]|nr:hypothetical protein [Chloroflexota bacterium]
MTDSFNFPSLPTYFPSALLSNGQPGAGQGSQFASFAMLLGQALVRMAQELQTASPYSMPSLPFFDNSFNSFNSTPTPLNNLMGMTYAPAVATRAYQNAGRWTFIPVYIPEGASTPTLTDLVSQPFPAQQAQSQSLAPVAAPTPTAPTGAMPLSAFPRPAGDNGRGIHWIPTKSSTPEVVDQFAQELADMKVKWTVILNDGADIGRNDYLVQKLAANGIEPIMRVYTSGLDPIGGDLGAMVRHYRAMGVSYFQLYNEPNHEIENNGHAPDVNRYLDAWIPAAKVVAENGGLPGFGALSPGGPAPDSPLRADDRQFLREALRGIKARGETPVLDNAWLAAHNYMGDKPLADADGLLRVDQYDSIIREELGRQMPIIGTEGGSFVGETMSEAAQTSLVASAMKYMQDSRAPHNFAYTYWVLANSLGGSSDSAWEWQALFQPNHTSPIVDALKGM